MVKGKHTYNHITERPQWLLVDGSVRLPNTLFRLSYMNKYWPIYWVSRLKTAMCLKKKKKSPKTKKNPQVGLVKLFSY